MNQNRIPKKDAYIVLIISLIFIVSCILFKFSLVYGFLASVFLAISIFIRRGFSLRELLNMILFGLSECKVIFLLLVLIASTISIWMSSGIVPAMIYYGFEYMKGMNFLFATFIITSIISIFIGSAFGTISTIGIALLGLGKGFGIPSHILLGTIISGAFIADKISPISALLNLTLASTKARYRETIKTMLVTLVPTYILSGIFYFIIGRTYGIAVDISNMDNYKIAIKQSFIISPLLLLLPVLILIMSVWGIKIIPTITTGLLGGFMISLWLQKIKFIDVLKSIFSGYRGATSSAELNKILVSGGILSMVEVMLIIAGVVALNSLLEGTGIIRPIIDNIISKVKSKSQLIFKTGLISSILTIVTCDQTIGIILPGRLLREKYNEWDINDTVLARTISDTGTIIAPLMPWNVNSIFIFIISGISAFYYAPYAVLCYISPVVTFITAYFHKEKRLHAEYKNIV
ncbi:Na+/H+ antiporter NhaC family protein [Maledivibacter halophilus]|uniref:Transporter, NhaC family n=1 Tax=Maledivibacter halophilus TaxID=36842 RepID=A0A1T5MAJ3_9FIRM|nr:Na+/H+ antiporter NhaC family protein [Maledivibacter halophilus]SKC85240.1 transporter, NhaC family [Maledivibacter halophilus]